MASNHKISRVEEVLGKINTKKKLEFWFTKGYFESLVTFSNYSTQFILHLVISSRVSADQFLI